MDESGRLEAAGCGASGEAQSNPACPDRHLRLPTDALELLEDRRWVAAEMVAHEQRRFRQHLQGNATVWRTARLQLAHLLGRHGRWEREHHAAGQRLFLRRAPAAHADDRFFETERRIRNSTRAERD